jgi:hypothetical protein
MTTTPAEFIIGSVAVVSGSVGSVSLATGSVSADGWLDIFEKGGFLLLTLLALGLFVWLLIPKILDWLRSYLERLEQRNVTQLESFLHELKEGRESRERTETAFRQALETHRHETVAAINIQTDYVKELVNELKSRPCQAVKFRA